MTFRADNLHFINTALVLNRRLGSHGGFSLKDEMIICFRKTCHIFHLIQCDRVKVTDIEFSFGRNEDPRKLGQKCFSRQQKRINAMVAKRRNTAVAAADRHGWF